MFNYVKKFTMEILPSVAATIIGAYIVNHYIVTKPAADAPVAGAVSAADPKGNTKTTREFKPAETSADAGNLPAAGVKAKGMKKKTRAPPSRAAKRPKSAAAGRKAVPRRTPVPASPSQVAAADAKSTIRRLKTQLAQARARIDELQASSDTDYLLDIPNRRGFERELHRDQAQCGCPGRHRIDGRAEGCRRQAGPEAGRGREPACGRRQGEGNLRKSHHGLPVGLASHNDGDGYGHLVNSVRESRNIGRIIGAARVSSKAWQGIRNGLSCLGESRQAFISKPAQGRPCLPLGSTSEAPQERARYSS